MTDPAARAPQPPVVLPAALYWELVATRRQVKLAAVDVRQAQQRAQQCDAALRAVVDRVTRKGVDPHQDYRYDAATHSLMPRST